VIKPIQGNRILRQIRSAPAPGDVSAGQDARRAVYRERTRRINIAGGVLVLPVVAYFGVPVILDVPELLRRCADRLSPCLQRILALWLPTTNATIGADSGSNKTEIDLTCPGIPNREADVQRLYLALAVTAITPEHGAERRAAAVADAQHLLKSASDAVPAH
jgi:hypothetical protein